MNESNVISQLANRDQERIRGYKDLLDFYQGKQWSGREKYGEKRLTFNYARVFIDKLTSYLMSGINFTVEAVEDSPEARARAEQAEKAITQVCDDNNLEQLDFETEIDCAILGDGCYKVTWEGEVSSSDPWSSEGSGTRFPVFSGGKVKVTAPDISGIYTWWAGDDVSRIWRVASKYQLTEEEVEGMYGKSSTDHSKLKTIVEVWTEQEFELYLDNVLIESKPNPYGFIPFIIFPNLREPKKFWGTSDLAPIIEPQRELNRAMSQISHILELSGNPVAVLENVEESTDIAVTPGSGMEYPGRCQGLSTGLAGGRGLAKTLRVHRPALPHPARYFRNSQGGFRGNGKRPFRNRDADRALSSATESYPKKNYSEHRL